MSDTSPTDPVTETFEAQRDRLRAVAYRMLRSHTDAEDLVQEAWLRLYHQALRPSTTSPARFQSEAGILTEALGPWITGGVHHVGSTAIPGLAAKPVIDIMVGVADLDSSRPCIDLLAELDYCYAPYRADMMHWFCKPSPARRTHHLHLVQTNSERFTGVLAFRDYLRAHPGTVQQYEQLKQQLATRHAHDRNAYTDGKSAMVAAITNEARRWSAAHGLRY